MPSSWVQIYIRLHDKPVSWATEQIASKMVAADGRLSARRVYQSIRDLMAGDISLYIHTTDESGVTPSGSIAVTQANAAGDTLTFTWKTRTVVLTEGAVGVNGFSRGASNTEAASNLATAIRRHPILGGLYTATPAAGTVTLTGKITGRPLNNLIITTNDATAFAVTTPAGGTDSTAGMYLQHIWSGRR